jgi:hypothetical protein
MTTSPSIYGTWTARGSFKAKEALKRKSKAEHMATAACQALEAFLDQGSSIHGKKSQNSWK